MLGIGDHIAQPAGAGSPGGGLPVDIHPIVDGMLREVLDGGAGRATLRVASSSMSPCLEQGDAIEIEQVRPNRLRAGDIVVFRSEEAGLVVHRLIWRDNPLGRPSRIYTKGDALARPDRSVTIDRVLGRVVSIRRGDNSFGPVTYSDRLRCLSLAARLGGRRLGRSLFGVAGRAGATGSEELG